MKELECIECNEIGMDERIFLKLVYKLMGLSLAELQIYRNVIYNQFICQGMPDMAVIISNLCDTIINYKNESIKNMFKRNQINKIAI